jgi:hypothetical protein
LCLRLKNEDEQKLLYHIFLQNEHNYPRVKIGAKKYYFFYPMKMTISPKWASAGGTREKYSEKFGLCTEFS